FANVKRMLRQKMSDKTGNYIQFSSCADIRIGSVSIASPVDKQKQKKRIVNFEQEDNYSADPFISNTRVEESTSSRLHSKNSSSSSNSQQINAGSSRDANNLENDRPCTPPDQIHYISRNQNLLRRLREEKLQMKSEMKPIHSNIINTTNKYLMERLQLNCDYHLEPFINNTTKFIDELIENSNTRSDLRKKLQVPFVLSEKTYSFNKHYEIS
ncbi:7523_t:CDS:2, partial [Gigaspora rosea]